MFWIVIIGIVLVFLMVRSYRKSEAEHIEPRPAPDHAVTTDTALPETDAWDLDAYQWEERVPVTMELSIHYMDIKDQRSERNITTLDFAPIDGDVMVRAYCHSRQANRTFRVSRMRNVVDRESGAPIEDVTAYLMKAYSTSPEGKLRNATIAFESELLTLVFVARANGRMLKKERLLIAEYLAAATGEHLDVERTQESLKSLDVTSSLFHRALKELVSRTPEERLAIIDTASQILQLQKTPDPIAAGVVNKIEKRLQVRLG